MRWMLDLELEHGVVATGTKSEGMKNQFIESKAAMIFDEAMELANIRSVD